MFYTARYWYSSNAFPFFYDEGARIDVVELTVALGGYLMAIMDLCNELDRMV